MRNDFESNYLMHHGILGQKWGDKNGPPYPLDAGDHSPREKKAGWLKSLKAKSEAKKKKKRQQENLAKARAAKQAKAQAAAEEKRKEEEWAKKKEEILRSANPQLIMEYRDKLSDKEMQDALNRVRNERAMQDLANLDKKVEKTGVQKIESFMKGVGKVTSWANTGIKAYDTFADIYNAFLASDDSEKLPKIKSGNKDKKKDKKKDNKDDDD